MSADDFAAATVMLEANYGDSISEEKIHVLFQLISEEGWSSERFQRTLKWFLKTKRFPAWTIADWFDYGVKLYPFSWYAAEVAKHGGNGKILEQMDVYRINGKPFYRYKDGNNEPLPFERIG